MNSSLWWARLGSNQRPADYEYSAGELNIRISYSRSVTESYRQLPFATPTAASVAARPELGARATRLLLLVA